jgi:hypothetical protein
VLVRNFLCLVLVCAVSAVSGYAQTSASSAAISGSVRDAAGQVVPGVVVTLRELTTNQTRRATSNAEGSYHISVLPVGTYEVRAEGAGFAPYVNPRVTLAVGITTTLDITLRPAGVSAEITVTDRPPAIDPTQPHAPASTLCAPPASRHAFWRAQLPGVVSLSGRTRRKPPAS